MGSPRVLFLASDESDFLADSLLHGLRSVLGDRCVDFPKKELMYRSCPRELLQGIHGRGFTLYGRLEDIPIARVNIARDLRAGAFDLVVFSDIWRSFGYFVELLPHLGATRVAVLDGADTPAPYPFHGRYWRQREWLTLPRAHVRFPYYKRELTPETLHYRFYKLLPRRIAGLVPMPRLMRPIAFSIPDEHVVPEVPRKTKLFPTHIVDAEIAAAVGGSRGYAFDTEGGYFDDLRSSSFGVTTKRAGWDCLRHYELAASACALLFRELSTKPITCAPHGLSEANAVSYTDGTDVLARARGMTPAEQLRLQSGALAWARANTTTARARSFLAGLLG